MVQFVENLMDQTQTLQQVLYVKINLFLLFIILIHIQMLAMNNNLESGRVGNSDRIRCNDDRSDDSDT